MTSQLLIFFSLISFYTVAQSDTVTMCRFYSYNDESVFKKLNEKTLEINFIITHQPDDSLNKTLNNLLSMKKGIYSFNVNEINATETTVFLSTSNLFDAHYLRVILEYQMKISHVKINDNHITWEEFEKMFLTVSN